MTRRPLKSARLVASRPDAVIRLEKTWEGPCVFIGAEPTTAIKVSMPDDPVIPIYPRMGPLTREKALTTLMRAAPYSADVFVVELVFAGAVRGQGLVAVPRATTPRFFLD
jgi:hypothetical protein